MKRWALRLLGALVVAVTLLAVFAWLTFRNSLPQLDGQIVTAELASPASIVRDAAGYPTITAVNRNDLAFATGFAHGQDRFFQMDLIRRQSAGELSELFGSAALSVDKRYRWHQFRARARQVYQQLPPAEQALLDKYAAGVNAGLAGLSAKPFEYFLLRAEPESWQAEDSFLAVYTMFSQLNDSLASRDVRRGLMAKSLPPSVFDWLYPVGSSWDAALDGSRIPSAAIPDAEVFRLTDTSTPLDDSPSPAEKGRDPLRGSNNWAVSGELTASGRALVANDMHLGLSVPNIYYRARLVVTGKAPLEVTGVTLPGAPFVVAGSNGRVAWGYTNSYGDWSDAVILRPGAAADTYRTPDGEQTFDSVIETIQIRNEDSVVLQIRNTIWGPVREDIDYPDGEIAISWLAHKPEAVNLNILELERASSLADALAIANRMGIPPQNFVAGDADGNIGWTIAGRIPKRAGANEPVDWSEGGAWDGWQDPAAYPRIENPAEHRLWTANARAVGGTSLALIGDGGYDRGARAGQIRDSLYANELLTPADMLAIQRDERALFLVRWRQLILDTLSDEVVGNDRQLAEYRRLVSDWVPRASPDSVGYRLVRAFRLEVEAMVFHALARPAREQFGDDVRLRISNQFEGPLWQLLSDRPAHLLPPGYQDWESLLLAAIQRNLDHYAENYDGPLRDRRWGELNTLRIQHPLSRAVPAMADLLDMPAQETGGDADMPWAQGPTFGASERFAVYPGDEANSLMQMPTGQSGHPLSDFYRGGHDDWVQGRAVPFLPTEARHTLELRPSADQ